MNETQGSRIRIRWSSGEVLATLGATPAAQALLAALPVSSRANTWGDEVYFRVPADVQLEADAREVVDPGTVCYWVQGGSLALPWGPTPASRGDECRLVTRVNCLGRIEGDPSALAAIRSGEEVTVEAA